MFRNTTQANLSLLKGETTEQACDGKWKRVEIFHDGDAFFDALEAEIRQARSSVDLESYIFATDVLGERVLRALGEAQSRGVAVRVIVDGIGSMSWVSALRGRAHALGLQLKVFHELPWERWWRGAGRKKRRQETIGRWIQRINNRNHRKVCIIDGSRAFVGSMNVIECHLRSRVGAAAWRDTGVLIEGVEVQTLSDSFQEVWIGRRRGLRRGAPTRAESGDLIRLNARRGQRRDNYLGLLVRLLGARRRIWIENAYFVPDGSLLRVLRVAAEAGVDVKIVVPAFSDVVFIPWVASAFHLGLLRAGVRVFEYTKTVLHAKTMIIDDWGLVGSSNLNHRSLLHDLEADAALPDPEACRVLAEQFEADCRHSVEITLENWGKRPLLERLVGRALLAARRLL